MRYAIVPAAGSGRRFNGKKQFFKLKGIYVVEYVLRIFQKSEMIDGVILILPDEDMAMAEEFARRFVKLKDVVAGGMERQDSVYNGVRYVAGLPGIREVVIHDGVRPVLSRSILENVVIALEDYEVDGVVTGVMPKDTVKEISSRLEPGDYLVNKTLDRNKFVLVQTPQVFKFDVLLECHERAREEDFLASDDAALLERYGYSVVCVPGDYRNIKITTREDIKIVSLFL